MPLAHPFKTTTATSADGTQLAVHTTHTGDGDEGKPWVLLVASPSASLPFWRPMVEYLGSRFRFITWSYRGLYGSRRPSGGAGYSVDEQRQDLEAALASAGVERCTIVGWSVGALLALDRAADHRDRVESVVLLNAVYPRSFSVAVDLPSHRDVVPSLLRLGRKVYPRLAPLQKRVAGAPEAAPWLKRLGLAGGTLDDELFAEIAGAFETIDLDAYRGIVEAFEAYDRPLSLEQLRVPVLVVAGDEDRIGSLLAARRVVRRLPYGELFVVKGGTHYTPLEFPELVNLRIEKFLDAHPIPSAR